MASKKLEYDADIIREFAANLYRRARSLAVGYSVVGGFLGGLVVCSAAAIEERIKKASEQRQVMEAQRIGSFSFPRQYQS